MAANHPELVDLVAREAQLPPQQAERALRATRSNGGCYWCAGPRRREDATGPPEP